MIDPLFGYDFINDAFDGCTYTCQTEALARMIAGENVFLSGAAGSGKTTVINTFIKRVKEHRAVAVTASTGIAAVLIGGKTIHSWAGLGIDTTPFNPKDISQFMYARSNMIRNTDTLIIDEISMLPAHLFTKLDAEFKFFRGNNEPFGGMQIIASGDFQQLPPVDRDDDVDNRFCILTDAWKDADFSYCYLDHLYRSTDTKLSTILDEIASGEVSEESKNILLSRRGNPPKGPHIQLFTTNRNVDRYNEKELEKNPAKEKVFSSHSQGSGKKISQLMKQQRIPGKVTLKVGATVMLTANLNDDGVVNAPLVRSSDSPRTNSPGRNLLWSTLKANPSPLGNTVTISRKPYATKMAKSEKSTLPPCTRSPSNSDTPSQCTNLRGRHSTPSCVIFPNVSLQGWDMSPCLACAPLTTSH